jgi:MoaA/NifB/PqqE/SkfB family radical SAM enzyme
MGFSVGIGLTNNCNLACDHCYRDTDRIDNISLSQIGQICDCIPVDALGMGTGENALNPEFGAIVRFLHDGHVKLSVASNGYTLTSIPDEVLQLFHDVEVSIDFATAAEQDDFRGAGNWALVHSAMERCHKTGIEVSILTTMMRTNYQQMDALVALARRSGANLRVNVYQPVKTDTYQLSYEEFWEGYRRLFSAGLLVSCSEPVVRAVLGFDDVESPCGRNSIRFSPRGKIIPCVYWPVSATAPTIADLAQLGSNVLQTESFSAARRTPSAAADCPCQGGCASRRALSANLDDHDRYCPWIRDDEITLDWHPAPEKDLMRSANVCTTVVV